VSQRVFQNKVSKGSLNRKLSQEVRQLPAVEIKWKIFFILFTSTDTLLTKAIKNELSQWKDNIQVISFFSKSENELIELAKNNPKCDFFMDEVLLGKNGISTSTIAKMSTIISKSNYLWVACQSDKLPNVLDRTLDGKQNHIFLI